MVMDIYHLRPKKMGGKIKMFCRYGVIQHYSILSNSSNQQLAIFIICK